MKIRSGFVSNSSSSSFCMYGKCIRDVGDEFADIVNSRISEMKLRLNYVMDGEDQLIMIGLSPFDMEMDETKAEFIRDVNDCIGALLSDLDVKTFLSENFPDAKIDESSACHEGIVYC